MNQFYYKHKKIEMLFFLFCNSINVKSLQYNKSSKMSSYSINDVNGDNRDVYTYFNDMKNVEVLQLMNGVVDVRRFTKNYLTGDKTTTYHVMIRREFHGTHHRYCFSNEFYIYVNEALVFQKCDKHWNSSILSKNITSLKKKIPTVEESGCVFYEKEMTQPSAVDYIHREWSIIGALPVIINCTYKDKCMSIVVYSQDIYEAGDEMNKFGITVFEREEEFDNDNDAIEYCDGIEQGLFNQYYYNEKRQELVSCDDEEDFESDCDDE